MDTKQRPTAAQILAQPITLPCGLVLPNRLVKCPMQETLAIAPYFDPPVDAFQNLYGLWAASQYGLIITGQVQIDIRFLSVAGDVVVHPTSEASPHFQAWQQWAQIAQSHGTPCIVQLAHPGRMSPAGAGNRPSTMPPLCPSNVPVKFSDKPIEKYFAQKMLGAPQAMTVQQIDEVVEDWKRGARVTEKAGFAGIQLHAAHGFLLSQFLSPHTNRRTDEYGGTPEKRLKLLKRLVTEIRAQCSPTFCLSVKLNSGDYMGEEGLSCEEALEQVRWLIDCGMVDMIEISGGNAEAKASKLANSFGAKSMDKAPVMKESTRIRESFFSEFAERVMEFDGKVPIQLSGGFRSRVGMADAIDSGITDLIGLGRAVVLEPDLPRRLLLDEDVGDEKALARSHQISGLWFVAWFPIQVVGRGLPLQFFYYNMKRLGKGLNSAPDASLPWIFFTKVLGGVGDGLWGLLQKGFGGLGYTQGLEKVE